MVFDLTAQLKFAQSITDLTIRNLSTASEAMSRQAAPAKTTSENPLMTMIDPDYWMGLMSNRSATSASSNAPFWLTLNPAGLAAHNVPTPGLQDLGLPNMAIPLGLNPFGTDQTNSKFPLPVLSTKSPLAGGNEPEWPNMFWWLVRNDGSENISSDMEEAPNPLAMIIDPFGLLQDKMPESEPVEMPEQDDGDTDLFGMMFDPFGLMKETTTRKQVKTRKAPRRRAAEKNQYAAPTALDLFDPFGLIRAQVDNLEPTRSRDRGRNMFFGFQPGARHPLMNDGRPTGMFYLAIALPEEIKNLNPALPPWNLAV